jgi:hypothetical protein
MIEKISETRPPSLNHLSLVIFTMHGTTAVFMKRANVSLNATDRLYAVYVSCFSLVESDRTTLAKP